MIFLKRLIPKIEQFSKKYFNYNLMNTKESHISIIIPCYNIETHIERCINSVLSQSKSDFELLLIDDGSTDQTLAILHKFEKQDERINVFSHKNQGVSFTRNRGIALANADWIMFIDGDDYLKVDFLEQHLNYASSTVWPISGMVNVNGNSKVNSVYFQNLLELFPAQKIKKSEVLKILKYYSLSSPCCRVYSKKIVEGHKIKFNENVSYQEDLLFNLDYLNYVKEVQLIDYFGYFYVQHEGSSSLKFHKNFGYNTELFEKLVRLIQNKEDEIIVHEFIFQTFMKRIANIFHRDSNFGKKQVKSALKNVLEDSYFSIIRSYIHQSSVNFLLKKLLFFKSTTGLYFYFRLKY